MSLGKEFCGEEIAKKKINKGEVMKQLICWKYK